MAKILLVEDDNNLREIYEARLQAEGYTVVSAHDGEEALVVAKDQIPELIISDVMMPKISGFEMLDILRNTEGLKEVKVIMLTALGQNDDQQRANKLGADRYLVKSQVTLEDIVKAAHELLVGPTADQVESTLTKQTNQPAAPESTVSSEPAVASTTATSEPVAAVVTTSPAVDTTSPTDTQTTDNKLTSDSVSSLLANSAEPDTSSSPATPAPEPASVVPTEPVTQVAAPSVEPSIVQQATAAASNEPASPEAAVSTDNAASTSLADTTSDEESKVQSEINNFANAPVASETAATSEPAATPAPTSPTEPESVITPVITTQSSIQTTAEVKEESGEADSSETTNTEPPSQVPSQGGQRVIEPITSGEVKPSINELLAKEEAKDIMSVPAGTPVVSPQPIADVSPPAAPATPTPTDFAQAQSVANPAPGSQPLDSEAAGNVDPNSIAL